MSSHVLDTNYYTENNPDTLDRDKWYKIYQEMRNCAYDTTLLDEHDSVYYKGSAFSNDTLVVDVLAFNYLSFVEDALTTTDYYDFDTILNIITDKPGRELNPFFVRKVFAASPMEYYIPYAQFTYRIDPAFIFHDVYNDFVLNGWILQMDFGDGAGWQTINPSIVTHYMASYTSSGKIYLKTRVVDAALNPLMSSIAESYILNSQNKGLPPPDDHIYLPGLTAGIWNPCDESGEPLKKVIIYVEGYDPGDFTLFGNRTARQIYSEMIEQEDLAGLRNLGYTFVVVDWKQSSRPIETNAMELVELINVLKCKQTTITFDQYGEPVENASHEQFVILAESMGGLVARYALCFMEQNPNHVPTWCLKSKMHNTRLLITLDSPHEGANIPISYQILYRNLGAVLLGSNSLTQAITGGMTNIILDAMSVKQMLLYHVNSYNPITGTCGPDIAKTAFDASLSALGDFPQYCKMIAMSNGSLRGHGQPKLYDPTTARNPNDHFIQHTSDSYTRILGQDFLVMHTEFDLRSTPNGNGPLNSMAVKLYMPVPRMSFSIKWKCPVPPFCPPIPKIPVPSVKIWFDVTLVSNLSLNLNGTNMKPYDVIPGSYQDYPSTLMTKKNSQSTFSSWLAKGVFFGHQEPTYNASTHTWSIKNGFSAAGFGASRNVTLYSDGVNFCYIPVFSALSYNLGSNSFWHNIRNENISVKTSATPFDIISGIIHNNPRDGNWSHLSIRNEALGSWNNLNYDDDDINLVHYRDCQDSRGGPVYVLNREIGDDTLLIENRTSNWTCLYDAETYIGVNQHSTYYEYPGVSSNSRRFDGFYSKANAYTVNSGTTILMTTDTNNIIIPGSLAGSCRKDLINWVRCCNNYPLMTRNISLMKLEGFNKKWQENRTKQNLLSSQGESPKTANSFFIYPNPALQNLSLKYSFSAGHSSENRIRFVDITGRLIKEELIREDKGMQKFDVSNWPSGIYSVQIMNEHEILYTEKISILH